MDLASVVAALASVGVRVSGSTPNNNIQGDSSRACPTGLAGPEPSGTLNDPGQHFHLPLPRICCTIPSGSGYVIAPTGGQRAANARRPAAGQCHDPGGAGWAELVFLEKALRARVENGPVVHPRLLDSALPLQGALPVISALARAVRG